MNDTWMRVAAGVYVPRSPHMAHPGRKVKRQQAGGSASGAYPAYGVTAG